MAIVLSIIYLYQSQSKKLETYNPNDYIIIQRLERNSSEKQYTQGLTFVNQTHLLESSGLYGESEIHYMKIDKLQEFKPRVYLEDQFFAEGCDLIGEFIYQLTWQEHIIFKRERATLVEIGRITLEKEIKEGWGLTHSIKDGKIEIYITNGSNRVFVLDNNFKIKSILEIKFYNGTVVNQLNELEYANGLLYANIYLSNFIVAIDLESTKVVKYYDFSQLKEEINNTQYTECLNGIAYRSETDTFWITGKFWPYFWEVQLN